ncbi:MAG: GAF and ANTAR domain-containing protein [Nocardioides sp.]
MELDVNRLLSDAAHELATEPSVVTTLEHIVALCTEAIDTCTGASITVLENGELRTLAASDDSLAGVDRLQQTLAEGPCYAALTSREPSISSDLDTDERWSRWGPEVVSGTGIRSLICYSLFAHDDAAGTLTLYAARPDAFGQEDVLEGQVLAAHASVALATQYQERQLQGILERRTVIGQATGILIERFGLSSDQAFAVMRRVSQHHNIKLHALAQHLVETGELLDSAPTDDTSAADRVPGSVPAEGVTEDPRVIVIPPEGVDQPEVEDPA